MAGLESPLNKLGLRPRLRAGRRGGGARRLFAGSGVRCRIPSAWFIASLVDGLQWLLWLDILRGSGCAPRRYSFIDAKISPRAAGDRCGDSNGTSVPNRLMQVTQRPIYSCLFSSGLPAVRRRGSRRRRSWSCRIFLSCVRHFLFTQGCFCKRDLDYSSVLQMYLVQYLSRCSFQKKKKKVSSQTNPKVCSEG